jgi:uracil-DNA glycosylase
MDVFIRALARYRAPSVFNPWRQNDPQYDAVGKDPPDLGLGPRMRRENLRAHLDCDARYILIGEAPGYQGCRFSGIPFTSERLIVEGSGIPRVAARQLTARKLPWSEPSATIVWKALYKLEIHQHTILWNAFPFHPHKPDDPYSNRAPTKAEIEDAESVKYVDMLMRLHRKAIIVAVGRTAEKLLHSMAVPCFPVRHPSMGGALRFVDGLTTIVKETSR